MTFEEKRSLIPEAVVESFYRQKKHTPEIMVNNQNYILDGPQDTHEKALAIAEAKCAEMCAAIQQVTRAMTHGLKKAKE